MKATLNFQCYCSYSGIIYKRMTLLHQLQFETKLYSTINIYLNNLIKCYYYDDVVCCIIIKFVMYALGQGRALKPKILRIPDELGQFNKQ